MLDSFSLQTLEPLLEGSVRLGELVNASTNHRTLRTWDTCCPRLRACWGQGVPLEEGHTGQASKSELWSSSQRLRTSHWPLYHGYLRKP